MAHEGARAKKNVAMCSHDHVAAACMRQGLRRHALQNQITAQIAVHNADIANLDPRVAKYEGLLVIDDVAKTITIPADYKLVVQGAFEQGV